MPPYIKAGNSEGVGWPTAPLWKGRTFHRLDMLCYLELTKPCADESMKSSAFIADAVRKTDD